MVDLVEETCVRLFKILYFDGIPTFRTLEIQNLIYGTLLKQN